MKILKNLLLICSLSFTSNLVLAKSNDEENLARALGALLGTSKESKEALKELEKECKRNDASSCRELGLMYVKGMWVKQDVKKGKKLLKKACKAKFQPACDDLIFIP